MRPGLTRVATLFFGAGLLGVICLPGAFLLSTYPELFKAIALFWLLAAGLYLISRLTD